MQTLVAPGHLAARFTGSQNLKGGHYFRHQATEPHLPQSPHHPPHHGAGPPAQQGHQVAVLMQQVQRGVHGVATLGLKGDEDGSPREFQQPAQALPAGAGPSAGCG